ncbi:MAG: HNH endonuclease signature motif containing protein [Candidatus Bathyarchaeia archaeon]|nr:HNH endonuclease signature motif containing protein [Candidatus Bathyarchaeia archaeon]
MWDEEERRPTPRKALKKMVYQRDKGKCRVCGVKVDPFNFEIGHDIAHSRGGKLTLRNAILLCSACNRSMRTLSLKQVRKKLGLPETSEEKTKKLLQRLSLRELRCLAKNHRIRVKGRVSEGFFSKTRLGPSKRQYVTALSKELNEKQINREIKNMPKQEHKKKRKRKKSGDWVF